MRIPTCDNVAASVPALSCDYTRRCALFTVPICFYNCACACQGMTHVHMVTSACLSACLHLGMHARKSATCIHIYIYTHTKTQYIRAYTCVCTYMHTTVILYMYPCLWRLQTASAAWFGTPVERKQTQTGDWRLVFLPGHSLQRSTAARLGIS